MPTGDFPHECSWCKPKVNFWIDGNGNHREYCMETYIPSIDGTWVPIKYSNFDNTYPLDLKYYPASTTQVPTFCSKCGKDTTGNSQKYWLYDLDKAPFSREVCADCYNEYNLNQAIKQIGKPAKVVLVGAEEKVAVKENGEWRFWSPNDRFQPSTRIIGM